MREYKIRFSNTPLYLDYIVDAKDAQDARVMGEIWRELWNNPHIESITDITKEKT